MAAPVGNQNKGKNLPWRDALQRAMARRAKGKDNALNMIADQVVKNAINGERWAIEEIANRTDGKAAQSVTVSGDEENPLTFTAIEYKIVKASKD